MTAARLIVNRGPGQLPFFAEYAYYLWGDVNYDTEGNCTRPTDRAWTALEVTHRGTGERLSISASTPEPDRKGGGFTPTPEIIIEGDCAMEAAALTAQRTEGSPVPLPADHLTRMARADRVQAQFLDPNLAAFDSFGWWGGWKWIGDRSTDFTSGLRIVMQSVHEKRLADPGLLEFLRSWHAEPPKHFHEVGVAFALEFLSKLAP